MISVVTQRSGRWGMIVHEFNWNQNHDKTKTISMLTDRATLHTERTERLYLNASNGITLKQFFTEALKEYLHRCSEEDSARKTKALWMLMFDKQSELTIENRHILGLIKEDFEAVSSAGLPLFCQSYPTYCFLKNKSISASCKRKYYCKFVRIM